MSRTYFSHFAHLASLRFVPKGSPVRFVDKDAIADMGRLTPMPLAVIESNLDIWPA